MVHVVRKPASIKAATERLKISLPGHHTIKQKFCMVLQAMHHIQNEIGFSHCLQIDIYVSPADQHQRPYTHFPDGTPIHKDTIVIEGPYSSAADEHQA